MTGFEAYRNRRRVVTKGCPRCGKTGDGDGSVVVQLRDKTGPKTIGLTSLSKAMCEGCCVQTYEELAVMFESKMKK